MKRTTLILFGILAGILNGLFGAGGGVVAVLSLEKAASLSAKEAHATAISVMLLLSLVSILGYAQNGYFDWRMILLTSLGGSVGGVIGANLLNRLSPRHIHKIFGVILAISALRMVVA